MLEKNKLFLVFEHTPCIFFEFKDSAVVVDDGGCDLFEFAYRHLYRDDFSCSIPIHSPFFEPIKAGG